MSHAEKVKREADKLRTMVKAITPHLSPEHGFLLMTFDFGPTGGGGDSRMNYISNAERADVLKMMREFIVKAEDTPASAAVRILNTNAIEPATTQLLEDCARVLRTSQPPIDPDDPRSCLDREVEVMDLLARLDVCLRVRRPVDMKVEK